MIGIFCSFQVKLFLSVTSLKFASVFKFLDIEIRQNLQKVLDFYLFIYLFFFCLWKYKWPKRPSVVTLSRFIFNSHFDTTAGKFNRKQRQKRRGSNNTFARSRRGSNQNALTKIMESVTLVLSGTLLALPHSGTRDKYLWLLLSDWARTMTPNSWYFSSFSFFLSPHETSLGAVSLSANSTSRIVSKIFDERFLRDTMERQSENNKGRFIKSSLTL